MTCELWKQSEMFGIFELPAEINEKILSYLDASNLLAAVRTCPLWQSIAEGRLLKNCCLKTISKDILVEMTHGKLSFCNDEDAQDPVSVNWRVILEKWGRAVNQDAAEEVSTTGVDSPPPDSAGQHLATTVSTSCCTFVASGDFIVTGDTYNNLVWYNSCGQKVFQKSNCGEQVVGMGLLNVVLDDPFPADDTGQMLEHDAIVVMSRQFLAVYSMHPWGCKELFHQNEKNGACKVSVQGNQFVHYNNDDLSMTIRRVTPSKEMLSTDMDGRTARELPDWDVHVKTVSHFVTPCRAWNWKLWKKYLITLLQDGSVITWDTTYQSPVNRSNIILDFLYPFDSFMYRGLIFVNVSTARALLNYWHVNTGPPYWLISSDGLVFTRLGSVLDSGDEITAVCIHQALVVFGTNEGRVYLYRHTATDEHVLQAVSKRPAVTVKVANGPIHQCDFSVTENHCLIFAKIASHTLVLVKLPSTEYFDME